MNLTSKSVQGKLWSTAPVHWAKYQEPSFMPMYQYVLEQVPLNQDNMLLDLGCGAGLFLSMASSTGAGLHGVDAAHGMLSIARGRATGASLLVEDLESLPFIDGTFDVVTTFTALEYAGSLRNALEEARRVVKRHGIVAIGACDPEYCPSARILDAVAVLAPSPAGVSTGVPEPHVKGQLEALCKAVGLEVRTSQTVFCPLSFNSDSELLDAFLCMGPCAGAAEIVGEDELKNTIIQHAQSYNLANDVYYLKNHYTVFITRKI